MNKYLQISSFPFNNSNSFSGCLCVFHFLSFTHTYTHTMFTHLIYFWSQSHFFLRGVWWYFQSVLIVILQDIRSNFNIKDVFSKMSPWSSKRRCCFGTFKKIKNWEQISRFLKLDKVVLHEEKKKRDGDGKGSKFTWKITSISSSLLLLLLFLFCFFF